MNNPELLKKVLSDTSYVQELISLDSAEAVRDSLSEKGIELSCEEITKIQETLLNNTDSELDENDLEDVSGGSVLAVIGIISTVIGVVGAGGNIVDKVTRRRW